MTSTATNKVVRLLGRLIRERDTYRELLSLTLAQLHEAHGRTRRQARTIHQLCAQRRAQGGCTRVGH